MAREHPMQEIERMANIERWQQDPSAGREGLLRLARLAYVGKRYEHMFHYMKTLVGIVAPGQPLSEDERLYFSTACFLFLGDLRYSYRYARNLVGNDRRLAGAGFGYLGWMAGEVARCCSEVVPVIDMCFLGPRMTAETTENRVFYRKLKGDFQRYWGEVKAGEEREVLMQDALQTYLLGKDEADNLMATNPTRLRLLVNLAFFHADVRGDRVQAYKVAHEVCKFFLGRFM